MMNPQHRQPLAAFAVLVCVAALAIGNDLRKSAVEILVERAAPQVLVGALAPDMVISGSLRSRGPSRDEARSGDFASSPGVAAPVRPYTLPNLFEDNLPPLPALTPLGAATSPGKGQTSTVRTPRVRTTAPAGSSPLAGGSTSVVPTPQRPPRSSVTMGNSVPGKSPSTGSTVVAEDRGEDPGRGQGHSKDGLGHAHHGTKLDKPEMTESDKKKAEKKQADRAKAEKKQADKAKSDADKAEKKRADKAGSDKKKAEKKQADKAKSDADKAEKKRADKAGSDKKKAEKKQADKKQADKKQADKKKADKKKSQKPGKPKHN